MVGILGLSESLQGSAWECPWPGDALIALLTELWTIPEAGEFILLPALDAICTGEMSQDFPPVGLCVSWVYQHLPPLLPCSEHFRWESRWFPLPIPAQLQALFLWAH